jgi:hypothetical protein
MIARSTAIHAARDELVDEPVAEPAVEVKISCRSLFDIEETAPEEASFIHTAMHSTVAWNFASPMSIPSMYLSSRGSNESAFARSTVRGADAGSAD